MATKPITLPPTTSLAKVVSWASVKTRLPGILFDSGRNAGIKLRGIFFGSGRASLSGDGDLDLEGGRTYAGSSRMVRCGGCSSSSVGAGRGGIGGTVAIAHATDDASPSAGIVLDDAD